MAFEGLSPRMQLVANKCLQFCRTQFGANSIKNERAISSSIQWTPTFHFCSNNYSIVAVEVSELIYPESLKIGAHEILQANQPIGIYGACHHEIFLRKKEQIKIKTLRNHGFGLLTVDSDGNVTEQFSAVPIHQYISEVNLEEMVRRLTPRLKVAFRSAHRSYRTNISQGLQEAGQIVEAIVISMARSSVSSGVCASSILNRLAAGMIDELYDQYNDHRAALGAARGFIRQYRNVASHAPRSKKKAMERINLCKTGFIEATSVSNALVNTMRGLHMNVVINL